VRYFIEVPKKKYQVLRLLASDWQARGTQVSAVSILEARAGSTVPATLHANIS